MGSNENDGNRMGLQDGVLKVTKDGLRFDLASGAMPSLFLTPSDVQRLVYFYLLDSKTGLC